MILLEKIPIWVFGALGAIFILWTVHRINGIHRWMIRLVWPYFIAEFWRWKKHAHSGERWRATTIINLALLAIAAGMIITYKVAETFQQQWPAHVFAGYRITAIDFNLWFVSCKHGYHNTVLWGIRWGMLCMALNLFTLLCCRWEDVSSNIRGAFEKNGFVKKGEGKIKLKRPFIYEFLSDAPFDANDVQKRRDAFQRAAGVNIIGLGNAPPSGIVIMASRAGLPETSLKLSDLIGAESSTTRFVMGKNPTPVYHDFQQRPQVGIFGPTGQGKSTLGRSACAMANTANPHTVNFFVDIEGVDYAAASREYSDRDRAGRTYQAWQNESKRLRNVIHVTDIPTLKRAMSLIAEEYAKRSHSCRINGVENVALLTKADHWQTKLADPELIRLQMRTTRILIFFDDFSSVYDEYSGNKNFKESMRLYRKFVSRGRKYMISTISLTGRPDFDTFAGARDEIGWYGVGSFARRAGLMVYEQEIAGTHRRGTFIYQLESPYEGTAIALGADVPLSYSNESLVAALTRSHAKASTGTLTLGDWFNTKLHQVQHDEELEKVHEGVEKFFSQ